MRAPRLSVLALALGGCDLSGPGDTGPGDTGPGDTGPADDTAAGGGLPACRAADGDPATVTAAAVSGDTLTASVRYAGGCATHDFTLCWPDGAFMESEPVQAGLELLHDANGDGCEAALAEDLAFDLSPLRRAWQDAYGASAGTIMVHVRGTSGSETVTYAF